MGQGCLLTYTGEILTDFWFRVGPVRVQIVDNTGECAFSDIHPNNGQRQHLECFLSQGFHSEGTVWLKHIHTYIYTYRSCT